MDTKKLGAIIHELKILLKKVGTYCEKNDYIYTDTYNGWLDEYNVQIKKYNSLSGLDLTLLRCNSSDLSSSQKTIREASVSSFKKTIETFIEKIESDVESERLGSQEKLIPNHQMRRCFKLGVDKCPLNPPFQKNKVFVAMPFDNKDLEDSYNYGIIPALTNSGLDYYRADEEISNKDIMCKICKEIQSCGLVIANISGLNPNVMLEHGIAYGLGKPVIIIKNIATKSISDIGSLEYIEYQHAHDLMEKLCKALK